MCLLKPEMLAASQVQQNFSGILFRPKTEQNKKQKTKKNTHNGKTGTK